MYCRHCTRRRLVGDEDHDVSEDNVAAAIDYIRDTPRSATSSLAAATRSCCATRGSGRSSRASGEIPHVEIIRIGTRMPVVLPQRVTTSS